MSGLQFPLFILKTFMSVFTCLFVSHIYTFLQVYLVSSELTIAGEQNMEVSFIVPSTSNVTIAETLLIKFICYDICANLCHLAECVSNIQKCVCVCPYTKLAINKALYMQLYGVLIFSSFHLVFLLRQQILFFTQFCSFKK